MKDLVLSFFDDCINEKIASTKSNIQFRLLWLKAFYFGLIQIHTIYEKLGYSFYYAFRWLCGCWITEKLAPTQSNIIFRLLQ